MKVIKVDDKIVVLEKVKGVEVSESGSGAKSNPFRYTIQVEYFGGDFENITIVSDEVKAHNTMNKIYEILKEEG